MNVNYNGPHSIQGWTIYYIDPTARMAGTADGEEPA